MKQYIKNLQTCLCIMLTCLTLQACATSQEPKKDLNPLGLRGHVTPEAEQAFSKADVLWRGGVTCSDPALAFEYLDQALELEPSYAEAFLRRALLSLQVGQLKAKPLQMSYFEDALDDATKAIVQGGESDAYVVRSLVLQKLGHKAGAARDITRAKSIGLSSLGALLLAPDATHANAPNDTKAVNDTRDISTNDINTVDDTNDTNDTNDIN